MREKKQKRKLKRTDSQSSLNEDDKPTEPEDFTNKGYYWPGKDYANTYRGDFKDLVNYSTDQFNREEVPRMPWRDQALVILNESARDLARHFIQRWNQARVNISFFYLFR